MSVDNAFLDDIAARPDDDTPRLIYADWLDDHGDADRAEFIRVQCRLAQRHLPPAELGPLQDRQRELQQRHDQTWCVGRPECFHYDRGFVERFVSRNRFSGEDDPHWFLANADIIFPRCPLLHDVYLSLKSVEKMAWVRAERELPGVLDQGVLESFSQVPGLRRLRSFALCHSMLDVEGLAWLTGSPHLTGLRRLSLAGSRLGTVAVEMLLEAPWIRGLASLDLSGEQYAFLDRGVSTGVEAVPNIGDAQALLLADCPALANLTELRLEFNPLASATIEALATSPHLARLTRLKIQPPRSNDPVWDVLGRCFGLPTPAE